MFAPSREITSATKKRSNNFETFSDIGKNVNIMNLKSRTEDEIALSEYDRIYIRRLLAVICVGTVFL